VIDQTFGVKHLADQDGRPSWQFSSESTNGPADMQDIANAQIEKSTPCHQALEHHSSVTVMAQDTAVQAGLSPSASALLYTVGSSYEK